MDTIRGEYTKSRQTPLQQFYADQTILITGTTGFIGAVLLEKLLRSCTNICKIYLLIRPKKDQNIESRLNELIENRLFDRVKKEVPNFRHKIVPIFGDLYNENLGLSEHDRNILIREVSIIFHVAATVRFTEKVHKIIILNVVSTKEILTLAKQMPKLQAFLYTSTIYSTTYMKHIDERFYTCPIDPDYLIELSRNLSEKEFSERIYQIMAETNIQWVNNYTFSKAVAEELLSKESKNIPLGIFRPSIVVPIADEPIAGWTNSFGGPMLITTYLQSGIMRVVWCNGDVQAQIVPVDKTVNALIASAWDVYNQFRLCRNNSNTRIYNCITSDNGPNWREFLTTIVTLKTVYPVNHTLWEPMVIIKSPKIIYDIYILFYHLFPGVFMDIARVITGHQPRILKMYKRIHKIMKENSPFILNEWIYNNHNVHTMWNRLSTQDQQLFNFNMKKFDWETYFLNYCKGKRLYLLNQNNSSLKRALTRRKRFYYMHLLLKAFIMMLYFAAFWKLYSLITK
ncbi:putative fatty acyl-CoA reductase CG5065 isoform X2 [Pseudomyrmex gracilis]|nr:putative fatty acyl-CoA reductase CG5065 isoform X2 [Pseudomyrmex gracilis]XP_020287703.1 putative fatty acyl-CoA reductase CG5065 isoform X2 [Pseudomyrmex gracilis]XP_020287704.1 putative fatty acyl-CoA reductase CG5065 isoform X2 [Pseudomyrmex gracilis]XP_020287706.1 putative fatty acyl-CoA reductase CG5065 isoform X2 [Pseudomyrmex gracilis]